MPRRKPKPAAEAPTQAQVQDSGVHHPFDKAARYAINIDPQGFLDWFFPALSQVARYFQWANVRGQIDPDAAERVGDTVADLTKLGDPNSPIALPIEIQTVPESQFLTRALGYAHMFRRALKRAGVISPTTFLSGWFISPDAGRVMSW